MLQNVTLTAGQTYRVRGLGDFFRILQAADPVTVRFYYDGGAVDEAEEVGAGYRTSFRGRQDDRFNDLEITSATTQDLQFVAQFGGDVAYDAPPTGNVDVLTLPDVAPAGGSMTQAEMGVGTASVLLLAANANRRYLLIQNKSAAATIYIKLNGNAASVLSGIAIAPGGSYESGPYVPRDAIYAIASAAATSVVFVEG